MKSPIFVLAFIGLLLCNSALARDNLKKWETFNFAKQKLTVSQLKKIELQDLQKLRGIVFGRDGRVFKEKTIKQELTTRPDDTT